MKKRGFEYLALDSDGTLYGLTSADSDIVVKRFDLIRATPDADIQLASENSVTDNEGDVADVEPASEPEDLPGVVGDWERELNGSARKFIDVEWQIPLGGFATPCITTNSGDRGNRCRVMYRDGRLVERVDAEVVAGSALAVTNGTKVAEWARPSF